MAGDNPVSNAPNLVAALQGRSARYDPLLMYVACFGDVSKLGILFLCKVTAALGLNCVTSNFRHDLEVGD